MLFSAFCGSETSSSEQKESCLKKAQESFAECKVKVIREIKHKGDRLFTQGFEIYKGFLYEGTGQEDKTALKKIDLKTGDIIKQKNIEEYFNAGNMFFGEGITVWNNTIIQLSWQHGKAHLYDLDFNLLNTEFNYDTEGWGLTRNSSQLIMSDGSEYLFFRNPETFEIERKMYVGVSDMNELEYVNGVIYSNVWMTNYIIMINENTGKVIGRIDASDLLCCKLQNQDHNAVLNGIAYNEETKTFFITGKNCPLIYEVIFEVK